MLYSIPDQYSFGIIFDRIHCGELNPNVDLLWADPESCTYFTAVTRKDVPGSNELHKMLDVITLQDIFTL